MHVQEVKCYPQCYAMVVTEMFTTIHNLPREPRSLRYIPGQVALYVSWTYSVRFNISLKKMHHCVPRVKFNSSSYYNNPRLQRGILRANDLNARCTVSQQEVAGTCCSIRQTLKHMHTAAGVAARRLWNADCVRAPTNSYTAAGTRRRERPPEWHRLPSRAARIVVNADYDPIKTRLQGAISAGF